MILEAMYNGEFYPCETIVPTSPEYRKAVQTCVALMEQLSQRLSKEGLCAGGGTPGAECYRPVRGKREPLQVWLFSRADRPAGSPRTAAKQEISDGRKSPRSRKENRWRGLSVYMVILSDHPKFPQPVCQSRSDRSDLAKLGTFQTLSRQRLWQWQRSPCLYHAEYLPR